MTYTYTPRGVCSVKIDIDADDEGIIRDIRFTGGCNGNLQGIAALARGRQANEVAGALKGIKCGAKGTSCPDQLAAALEKMQKDS